MLTLAVGLGVAVAPSWAAGATAGPLLTVDGSVRYPISPLIYGMNNADPALATQVALPVDRWGGNNLEAYNWEIGATNTGNDYFFENQPDCNDPAHDQCAHGRAYYYRDRIASDRTLRTATLLGLPMMGWVAKDARLSPPFTCGFPRSRYPVQQAYDPFSPNCGNGLDPTGQPIPVSLPPDNIGQPIDPTFDAAWIADLKRRFLDAAHGGVGFYELGNEPALWDVTHRALHPAPTTYDELWSRLSSYGHAVKAADPTAQVLGFSEFGWDNYFCSAADQIDRYGCSASSPDRRQHGGVPLVEWLLGRFAADQAQSHQRVLDYIDVHYYAADDPSPQAHSTEITRSLWDPTYDDPSYISRDLHQRIFLIRRMHDWVQRNYPGTKLSLSEYDLTKASDDRTNAVIEADTLGIFARERLDMAALYWTGTGSSYAGTLPAANPIADAFRLYRNYDGAGSRFGETYVSSQSSDQSSLSVYGAVRSDGTLTVAVVNKTATDLTSRLNLANFSARAGAQIWQSIGSGFHRQQDASADSTGITQTFPANSMTMLVLAPVDPGGFTATAPVTADVSATTTTSTTTTASTTASTTATSTTSGGPGPGRPVITRLWIAPSKFVAASAGPSIVAVRGRPAKPKPKPGAIVGYSDTQAGTSTFTIERILGGVRVGRRCVSRSHGRGRHRRPCVRLATVGSFQHADVAGGDRFRLTGRVGGRRLPVGAYRLTVVAVDSGGPGAPVWAPFWIKQR